MMMADVRAGGYRLRTIRNGRKLTLRDVERLSNGRVTTQELSRIEIGGTAKPSMETLTEIGKVYNMTPNEIAELYEYWVPNTKAGRGDRQLDTVRSILNALPPRYQTQALDLIEAAAKTVQATAQQQATERAIGEASR